MNQDTLGAARLPLTGMLRLKKKKKVLGRK